MDWRTKLLMKLIRAHLNGVADTLLTLAINSFGAAYDFIIDRMEASEREEAAEEERIEKHRQAWELHYRQDVNYHHMQDWAQRILKNLPLPKNITADELLGRGMREGWLHICPTCDFTDRKACSHCSGRGYWTNHQYETVAKAFDTIR